MNNSNKKELHNLATIKSSIDVQEKLLRKKQSKEFDCFSIKSANKWIEEAKSRPIPNQLFDAFWFEKEICILFADTNLGKSILAVQICDSISRGVAVSGFNYEGWAKRVIYFDFELSDKQFEKRYSNNYKDHYRFSDNLLRAELNPDSELPKEFNSYEDFLVSQVTKSIKDFKPEVLVIDNITYLKADNEKAKDALALMKRLKAIGREYSISILVLAHTPKRDPSKLLSKNDLSGSKMLINFCDSAFAIGESSKDSKFRYLKQIKQRNTECVYDSNNVVVCDIVCDVNFLKFRFIEYDQEQIHIKTVSNDDVESRNEQIIELKRQGLPNTEVARRIGVSEGTVRNVINKNNA